MVDIVLFSEAAEARAQALRKQSYLLNHLGGYAEADALRAKARDLECTASFARPQLVTLSRVCPVPSFPRLIPIKSQTSFAVPEGAA
jgi:hypothetical protein